MNRRRLCLTSGVLALILFSAGCSSQPQKVIDQDGKSSTAVQIGSMIWTGKNLDVTHYRNGDIIPEIKDPKEWTAIKTGAWCYNGNKPENGKSYGKLYNWYAVNDPRGLAPKGWHIPADSEWAALSDLLGGEENSAGALKAATHWKEPNEGANNKSGLSLLPAGARRDSDGKFMPPGEYSRLWSSTASSEKNAWCRSLGYFDAVLRRGEANKNIGFSVRCVKD